MAHEIDISTGKAAIFTVGEVPWHRLGKTIASAANSEDAIKLAGLDWRVDQRPLLTGNPDGSQSAVRTHVANVRADTGAVIGVVSTGYRVFQNRQAFDFMDSLVNERLCIYESAGALKAGKRVWMLARIPMEYRVAQDDIIQPYVLLTNSHDGSMALRMIPTTVRVVCQNTLNLALGRSGREAGLKVYHSENLESRVNEARAKLGVIAKRLDRFGEEAKMMARRQLSESELTEYFVGLVKERSERQQKKLLEHFWENFENERNALPGIAGSLWAAFNSVSEYSDHQAATRGHSVTARADNRLNSIWFGAANALKQQAYDSALQLAQAV